MTATPTLRWVAPLLLALLWIGCQQKTDPTAQPSAEALAILAKADALDGAEDKVVHKCLICSLGMDGHAKHTSRFGPYELHLCSKGCKKSFDADPEQAVLTTKIPKTAD
jgi:hypothetical protein